MTKGAFAFLQKIGKSLMLPVSVLPATGILIGVVAALLFNRFYRIQLPSYLGFFAGKRAVPILSAFAGIFLGVGLAFVWPPIGYQIKAFSYWAANGQPMWAACVYGIVER